VGLVKMIYREYEDLDEAFFGLNKEFLTHPENIVSYLRGAQGLTEDVILKVKKPITTLNLYQYAFDPGHKWQHLIRSYIDPESYWKFWEKIKSVGGTSYQFRFREREGPSGPCLIALVLTREDGKDPWARAKIMWRNSEINRKFAADLVLIYHFLNNPPEEYRDLLDIQDVTLILAQAFQSWRLSGPLVDQFCDWSEVNPTHPHTKRIIENHQKVFVADPQPPIKFAPVKRMQGFWLKKLAGEVPHSHPDDLSLIDAIRKQEQKNNK
jgi:hypothetical protein